MRKYLLAFTWIGTICCGLMWNNVEAQNIEYSKQIIRELCNEKYAGRGYVDDGVNKAADYLGEQFRALKLKPVGKSFFQTYAFPVNTHPFPIRCTLDAQVMRTGADFLLSPGCQRISGQFNLLHFYPKDSLEKVLLFKKIQQGFEANEALVLHKSTERDKLIEDSCAHYKHYPSLIIYSEEKKMTHSVSTDTDERPVLIFMDSVIKNKDKLTIDANHHFIESFSCKNIIGSIKGRKKDSFIVFSAHYDHLGKQGQDAMFPGASDNASGCSMLLYLADYYSKHKPDYTTIFILFSGEEAGLLGSDYFTTHPTFNIQSIKMLVNIDIMGSAENGITVVNGETFKPQFDLLTQINQQHKYLPEVKIRGKARNSDHYHFSEKGIPAFFIYSMGGPGNYHDIYDKADTLPLTHYEDVAKLLIDFVKSL
ncbi:MAG: M28 family peptidase [Chitinophagaceae bacterium]|nr:M28 family peptidase [Chitinophagaceae bacterium]